MLSVPRASGGAPAEASAAAIGAAAFDYIERIQSLSDPTRIQEEFAAALAALGFTNFTLLEFTPDTETIEQHIIDNRMPEEWSRRYVEQRYIEIDAVIAEVLTNCDPFLWSEALARRGADRHQRRIFHEAAEFHLNEGICIPIFGPRNYMAWVTLAGEHIDLSTPARAAAHMMALYTHNRLVRLVRPRKPPSVRLSPREVDCLRWVSRGKSDWDISEILHISENTAHWYIESAKRKLGVATRIQAVMGAIAEGILFA